MVMAALTVGFLAREASAADEKKDKDEVVREVERGFFAKSGIGSTLMAGGASGVLSGVMTVQLGIGQEVVDQERFSIAWSADYHQSLFNGPILEQLPLVPPISQGDIHVFGGLAGLEASFYPTRRLGVGAELQGGVFLAPVLMEPTAYQEQVVALLGVEPAANAGPIPVFGLTPTLEYYTKMSHFSVGVDAQILYWLPISGIGITPMGFMKYTF